MGKKERKKDDPKVDGIESYHTLILSGMAGMKGKMDLDSSFHSKREAGRWLGRRCGGVRR